MGHNDDSTYGYRIVARIGEYLLCLLSYRVLSVLKVHRYSSGMDWSQMQSKHKRLRLHDTYYRNQRLFSIKYNSDVS